MSFFPYAGLDTQCHKCQYMIIDTVAWIHYTQDNHAHIFHNSCLLNFMDRFAQPQCPICATRITHLNGYPIYDFESIGRAIYTAIAGNDIDGFINFLSGGYISTMNRGKAVLEVAKMEGDIEETLLTTIVQALLNNGTISDAYRGTAIKKAATNDNSALVEILAASGTISIEDRSQAILSAANNDNTTIVTLLAKRDSVFDSFIVDAKTQAVKNNNPELYQALNIISPGIPDLPFISQTS